VREIACPGCREILGVPEELEGGSIRCGACERVIDTRTTGERPRRTEPRDADDRPRARFEDRDADAPRPRSRLDDDFDRPKKKSGCGIWIGILGILGVLTLVCCGGGGFLIYKASDPKWEKFTPSDTRWSAEFPGKPKMETKPIEKALGGGTTTEFVGQRIFGQEAYLIGYTDVTPAELRGASRDAILTEILDNIMKEPINPREVSRRSLKIAGVDAKELVLDVTDPKVGSARMIVRVLVADNRIYRLIAVKVGNKGVPPEQAEKFFNSFTITAKAPSKPVPENE